MTTDSTAFSPPAAPKSRLVWIAVAAVALLAVIVVGGLGARRWAASRNAAEPAATVATTAPADRAGNAPGEVAQPAAVKPPQPVAPEPEPTQEQAAEVATEPVAEPAFQPGERPRLVQRPAEVVAETPTPSPAVPSVKPPVRRPEPAPVAQDAYRSAPQAPAQAAPVESAPAEPAEDPAAAREALIARLPVAREMSTGMSLSFEVQPKELAERLVVRLDRIVIGRASDWNAKKRDGRAYSIAEPGLHILTFLLDGSDVHRIRIDAQPHVASPTTIGISLPQFAKRGRRPGGG